MQQNVYVTVPPHPKPRPFANVNDVIVDDSGALRLVGGTWAILYAPGAWTQSLTLLEEGDPVAAPVGGPQAAQAREGGR